MSEVLDSNGREWPLVINVPMIKAVRKLGVDLGDPTGDTFDRLSRDDVLFVDTLWAMCECQATAAGITDEEFGQALVGDAIDRAAMALIQARLDFSRGRTRSLLQATMETTTNLEEEAMGLALAKIQDPDTKAKILAALERQMTAEMDEVLTQLNSATP